MWHQRIVAKYGASNITIDVIPCASEAEAFELEVKTIAKYKAAGIELCNLTSGGEGMSGFVMPEDVRRRISAAHKGRKQPRSAVEKVRAAHLGAKRTEETKARIREALKNLSAEAKQRRRDGAKKRPASWYVNQAAARQKRCSVGVSDETRKKLSNAWWGKSDEERKAICEKLSLIRKGHEVSAATRAKLSERVASSETRERISQALTGRVFSQAHREAIRAAKIGKKLSDAARAKMSEAQTRRAAREYETRPFIYVNLTTGAVYKTLRDAAVDIGVSVGAVKSHISGKSKTVGGQAVSRLMMAGSGAGPAPIAQGMNNPSQARFV
jgi:hypothetical protein